MKIVFLHVYSELNAGDAAIVHVMQDDYRAQYPGCDIVLSCITKPQHSEFRGSKYITSLMQECLYRSDDPKFRVINTLVSIVSLWIYRYTRLQFFLNKRLKKYITAIRQADLIVGVGGGYIIGKVGWKSTLSLYLTLFEFHLCKSLGKKVHLYAQSIGPFETERQENMAKTALQQLDKITLREELSRQRLDNMQLQGPEIRRAYDAAFYFVADTKTPMRNYLMKHGVFFTKPVLGITVKNAYEASIQQRYEQAIASLALTASAEYGYKVVFIPHVTAVAQNDDDRLVQQVIQTHLKASRDIIFLNDSFTYEQVKGIYMNCDLVVGTRMHSIIFSLASGIPALAIEYEPKTIGIMKQLSLEKWVITSSEIDSHNFLSFFSKLHKNKLEYAEFLRTILK